MNDRTPRIPRKSAIPLLAAALLLPLASPEAQAGPYDQPWAMFEMGWKSATRKESPVGISQVDGKSFRRNTPVEPGKRKVTLHFESARGVFRPEFVELQLDVQPCTRYRFAAEYENPTGPDWKPRIYAEPITECQGKFMKDKKPK